MKAKLKDFLTPRKSKRRGKIDTSMIDSKEFKTRYAEFLKKHSSMRVAFYKSPRPDSYIAHVVIPSRVNEQEGRKEEVFYNVIVEFFADETTEESVLHESNVRNYNIRLFSNSPSFVFHYAYVYYHNGLLIPECIDKLDDKILSTPPKKLNPEEWIGLDYTIFFALQFISSRYSHINKLNMSTYTSGTLEKLLKEKVPNCYEILRMHQQKSKYGTKHIANQLKVKASQLKHRIMGGPKQKDTETAKLAEKTKKTKTVTKTKRSKTVKTIGKRR